MKKYLKHPVYWLRLALSYPVMALGFGVDNLSSLIYKLGQRIQDLGVAIEGEVPDDCW